MNDDPTSGWTAKRIGRIPVVYLAGGIVIVLVIVAVIGSRNTTGATKNTTGNTDPATPLETYPTGLVGSVTTVTAMPDNTTGAPKTDNSSILSNDEWLRRSSAFLMKKGYNPGSVQLALSTYLDGGDLTYEQGAMRDEALLEYGLPPSRITPGKTADKVKPPTTTPTTPPNSELVPPNGPFPAPSNVTASRSGNTVTVSWTNPPGTQWIDLWRRTAGQSGRGTNIGDTISATTTYTDSNAPANVQYLVFAGYGARDKITWSNPSNPAVTGTV